jgi:hypothetical protein
MKYIGNTGTLINWDIIIESLKGQSPAHTGPDNSLEDPDNMIGFQEIVDKWNSVGVKTLSQGGTNNWEMYLPIENFDKSVVDTFSNYVSANTLFAWIANIHPGCMAHWHWDTSSKEDIFDNIPNIVRYSCFITKPHPGHVFMTSDNVVGYVDQGDIYQWPDRKTWHGGINFGFEEKYTLHFIGTQK